MASAACVVKSPRGGTALSTTAAGVLASRLTSRLARIAARSTADGRHGTKTRSDLLAASTAPPASRGEQSISASDAPALRAASRARASLGGCAATTTGGSSPRRSDQTPAEPCGSRSITTASPPASSCATARATDSVVFPAPPFEERSAIVNIMLTMIIMTAFSWQARFLLPNSVLRWSGEWLSIILRPTAAEIVGDQWRIS